MSFIYKIKTSFKLSRVFNLQGLLAVFAGLLYVIALFLPFVNDHAGYMSLFTGWMGLFVGRFSWLCNLYLFKVFYNFSAKPRVTIASVVVAIIFALLSLETLIYRTVPDANIGPQPAVLHLGYYLWVASFWLWAIRILIKHDAEKE